MTERDKVNLMENAMLADPSRWLATPDNRVEIKKNDKNTYKNENMSDECAKFSVKYRKKFCRK